MKLAKLRCCHFLRLTCEMGIAGPSSQRYGEGSMRLSIEHSAQWEVADQWLH